MLFSDRDKYMLRELTLFLAVLFFGFACYSRQAPQVKPKPNQPENGQPEDDGSSGYFEKSKVGEQTSPSPSSKESLVDFGVSTPINLPPSNAPELATPDPSLQKNNPVTSPPGQAQSVSKPVTGFKWNTKEGLLSVFFKKDESSKDKLNLAEPPEIYYQLVAGKEDQSVSLAVRVLAKGLDSSGELREFTQNLSWGSFTGPVELKSPGSGASEGSKP